MGFSYAFDTKNDGLHISPIRQDSAADLGIPLTCYHIVTYNTDMETEHVFKALADHHRRHLLDSLTHIDGQTLAELCAQLPMSRFGVMKHLHILEEAGLVTTRKVGREKLHYLNPVPMQDIALWVEHYRQLWEERFDRLDIVLQELQQQE
jgi:predicted transcriptional regulator